VPLEQIPAQEQENACGEKPAKLDRGVVMEFGKCLLPEGDRSLKLVLLLIK
jgi:hypothetical protein